MKKFGKIALIVVFTLLLTLILAACSSSKTTVYTYSNAKIRDVKTSDGEVIYTEDFYGVDDFYADSTLAVSNSKIKLTLRNSNGVTELKCRKKAGDIYEVNQEYIDSVVKATSMDELLEDGMEIRVYAQKTTDGMDFIYEMSSSLYPGYKEQVVLQYVKEKTYDVVFYVDGEVYYTFTTKGKEKMTLPKAPWKSGYNFDGWYFDKNTWREPVSEDSYVNTELKDNVIVYAKWVDNGEELLLSADKTTVYGVKSRSIKSIKIPDSVTTINEKAFEGCGALEKLVIPDTVTKIAGNAFSDCIRVKDVTMPVSAISYIPKNSLKEVVITSGSEVPESAFENCYSLDSVKLPDEVWKIDDTAFSGCYKLVRIQVSGNLSKIGHGAFYNCTSLKEIQFDGTDKKWEAIIKGLGWKENANSIVVKCSGEVNIDYTENTEDNTEDNTEA